MPTNSDTLEDILNKLVNYVGGNDTAKQFTLKQALTALTEREERVKREVRLGELEEAADFAEDVLQQFGYNGKSGGLSTLEWAEGIVKRFSELTKESKDHA